MNLSTKQKQTHRHRGWTCGSRGARAWGRQRLGVWDQQREAITCRIGKEEGPGVQHSELYSSHNEKDMKGNICVHV